MPLFTIDADLCARDGICAAECPVRIINMENGVPEPFDGAEKLCIGCGHCVSVCPTAAFSLKTLSPDQCREILPVHAISRDAAEQFLMSRRSIRQYRNKPVERPVIEELISLAAHAPSGHNRQPTHWHVIYEKDDVKKLAAHVIDWMKYMIKEHPDVARPMNMVRVVAGWRAGVDSVTRGAPHLIITHGKQKDPAAQTACTIAMTYLELAIPTRGLGGCWCGFFNAAANLWPPLKEALALPEGHSAYGTMMIGHPRYTYRRMPPRKAPRLTWR